MLGLQPAATAIITARGHEFVTLRHPTTIEITKDNDMTRRGDCIIAVGASESASELNVGLKAFLRAGARLVVTVECAGVRDIIEATGSKEMMFRDRTSIVVRRSSYVDDRTVGILSSKAAKDINRDLARQLANANNPVFIRLDVLSISSAYPKPTGSRRRPRSSLRPSHVTLMSATSLNSLGPISRTLL